MKPFRFVRSVAMFALLTTAGLSATAFLAPQSASAAEAAPTGQAIIASGRNYLGTPYEYGASVDQTRTFDCSSFTKTVFHRNGVELPRSSKQQYGVGQSIPMSEAQAGDLLFFRDSEDPSVPGHVAIYAGDGTMLHATASKGVTFTDVDDSYWSKRFMGAKRVLTVKASKPATAVSSKPVAPVSAAAPAAVDKGSYQNAYNKPETSYNNSNNNSSYYDYLNNFNYGYYRFW